MSAMTPELAHEENEMKKSKFDCINFFAIGIFGKDFDAILARAGKRVKQRKYKRSKADHKQKITKEEAMELL